MKQPLVALIKMGGPRNSILVGLVSMITGSCMLKQSSTRELFSAAMFTLII